MWKTGWRKPPVDRTATTVTLSRILIVTRNLPPLVGGMERLNWHMARELAKVAEVRVIGPQGSAAQAPAGVAIREAPLKPLWKFLLRARTLARREARAWNPDVILAGSGLTAPIARAAARTCRARTAVYVHGLDVAVRSIIYRALWLPAIRHADRVIANSRPTADLCRGIGVDSTRIGIVHPGVDLPADTPFGTKGVDAQRRGDAVRKRAIPLDPPSQAKGEVETTPFETKGVDAQRRGDGSFRQRHNLGDGPLLLSVGRLSERKGLREFVTRSLPQIVAAHPGVMLLIVGDAPNQALHAQAQTPESIQAAADAAGVGKHIRFLGVITDYTELGNVYRACDAHVFPVRQIPGDPEGFGMVAVEAAAHGLPTVAFGTGGVVDAVAEGRSGRLVPTDDYEALAGAATTLIAQRECPRDSCIAFARQFAWPQFGVQIAQQLDIANATHCRA